MTFFTRETPASVRPAFGLTQRSRAGLEILGAVQKFSSSKLRDEARSAFEGHASAMPLIAQHGPANDRETVRTNVAAARDILSTIAPFRLERFIQKYCALQIFARGIPAIEERRAQFARFMEPGESDAGSTLEIDEDYPAPRYHAIDWHLEPDGWDGYDLYGPVFAFAIGPLVFRHGGYAAVNVGDDLKQTRDDTLAALPRSDYARIFEPGCGGGTTIASIVERFPDAEVAACDLSPLLLRMAHKVSQQRGHKVAYRRRSVTDTGEADDSVDAVVTFALHHELPPKENLRLFAEMYRIMKPGGDFVLADPPPFREVSLFHAVILDWETKNRGEPFFSAAGLADWDEALRDTGFIDVESFAAGPNGYPWIIRGRKPERPAQAAAA